MQEWNMGHLRLFTVYQNQPNAIKPADSHLDSCCFNSCHTSSVDNSRRKKKSIQEESQSHRRLDDDFRRPKHIRHDF